MTGAYNNAGAGSVGLRTAGDLARGGYGTALVQGVLDNDEIKLEKLRADLTRECTHNESGLLSKKRPSAQLQGWPP